MTERDKITQKAYRIANREKRRLYSVEYNRKNRDKLILKKRVAYEQRKLPYYIVYSLNEGYCGITNNPYNRMFKHKHSGRDVDGYFVLDICKTKKEALMSERKYHEQGYKGKHPKCK